MSALIWLAIAVAWVFYRLRREQLRDSTAVALETMASTGQRKTSREKETVRADLCIAGVITLIVLLMQGLRGESGAALFIPSLAIGSLALLAYQAFERRKTSDRNAGYERLIPLVMERLVMAVESGLDLVPAIKALKDFPLQGTDRSLPQPRDPITNELLRLAELAERGMSFQEAASLVRETTSGNDSLKQVLLHLMIANREGGELVEPLREAARASQMAYQDSVEERIAKLPVKATFPLVLCFAGIMAIFLSVPLTRLLGFMTKAAPP